MRAVRNRFGALEASRMLGVERLVASAGRLDRLEDRVLLDGTGWGLETRVPSVGRGAGVGEVFADMDNDGDLDFVQPVFVRSGLNEYGFRVSRNDGVANFTPIAPAAAVTFPYSPVFAIDMDLDGDRDVLFRAALNEFGPIEWRFQPNSGDGTLGAPIAANIPGNPENFLVWDFDADGVDDLLVAGQNGNVNTLRVLRHSGNNQFEQVYFNPSVFPGFALIQLGNVDAGPTVDVVINGTTQQSYLHYATETGFELTSLNLGTSAGQSTQFVRYDTDEQLDVIVGGSVRLNDGSGTFLSPTPASLPTNSPIVLTGDFNGDGRRDAVFEAGVASENFLDRRSEYRLYRGDANGRWNRNDYVVVGTRSQPYRTAGSATTLTPVRLNADGVDDLFASGNTFKFLLSTNQVILSGVPAQVPGPMVAANAQTLSFSGLPTTADLGVTLSAYFDRNGNGVADDQDEQIGQQTTATGNTTLTITPPEGMALGAASVLVLARRDGQISNTLILDTTAWTRSFFPEGFRGTRSINEYVPFTNDNPFPVEYRVVLRYESGDRDQVIATGTIPAFTRAAPNNQWGVTTSERNNFNLPGRVGVPYAIEMQSSAPLAAMLVRYDRNFAVSGQSPGVGESFTSTISTRWALADVRRGQFGVSSDAPVEIETTTSYILLYNASPQATPVQVRFFRNGQQVAVASRTIDALRRGGVNLDDVPELASISGPLSVAIESYLPIAASLTTYSRRTPGPGGSGTATSQASMSLASPFSDQATATSVLTPGIPTRGPGAIASEPLGSVSGQIRLFNPTNVERTVTITARVDDAFRSGNPAADEEVATIVIPAFGLTGFSSSLRGNAALGLLRLPPASVRVTSNGPIIASALETRGVQSSRPSEANSTLSSPIAATRWAFGDGFRHSGSFQNRSEETLFLANTAGVAQDVTLRFYSPSAGTITTTINLSANGMRAVNVFALPELAGVANLLWFGISVEAAQPIVAGLSHFDGLQPGGWSSLGTPMGGIVSL
jgi:hypothetical protein